MLRRLALIVALLGPAAGLAQSAGQVLITPSVFGAADCTSTAKTVTLSWTSSSTPVAGGNELYKVWVSHTDSTCPTTGSPSGSKQLGADIVAVPPATQSYPTAITRQYFISQAGVACTANETIYVCVQHWVGGAASAKAVMTGSATLEALLPPVPVGLAVAPGDTALFVSWADGTSNGVSATSYDVTAVAQGNAIGTHTASTANRSLRLGGLTNGVTYGVSVASVSAGGNVSAATNEVLGTPEPVDDFWDQYTNDGGREQGGCAGGPAGALSLLGVALALRGFRRRS